MIVMIEVNSLLLPQIAYFVGQTSCQFGTIRLTKVKYDDRLASSINTPGEVKNSCKLIDKLFLITDRFAKICCRIFKKSKAMLNLNKNISGSNE